MDADLIISGARVFTADPERPWADAVAVRRRRIVYVGSDAGALALRGPTTRVVDGGGATLLPGFIDCHFHLARGAARLAQGLVEPPRSGRGDRESDGAPAGDEPDEETRREQLLAGLRHAAARGITSIHNMDGDPAQAARYADLAAAGGLTLRIRLSLGVKPEMSPAEMARLAVEMDDACPGDLLRAGLVTFFMDGVYETASAVTLTPYAHQPAAPDPIWDAARFAAYVTVADGLDLQVAVHACGDGAVRRALDGFAAARAANGPRDSRHRVEHIEMLADEDAPRFRELGVVASMQPLHAPAGPGDDDLWLSRIPAARRRHAFPWRTLRRAGARLVFGSDWPVAAADPLLGIHAAVNRHPLAPEADQRQTLEEAIGAYTVDAAYAGFQEGRLGQIRPGRLADLVLLDDNIMTTPPERIGDMGVWLTVCDGRIVHEALPAQPDTVMLARMQPAHVPAIMELIRRSFPLMPPDDQMSPLELYELTAIFPEGNVVALADGRVVGFATGTFIDLDFDRLPATEVALLIDNQGRFRHEPDGAYYYGSDIAVDPAYRGRGIGRRLYGWRKDVVRRHGRAGFVAMAVLPGYDEQRALDIHTYVERVVAGELRDPTLTVQLRNGFRVVKLVRDFFVYPRSDNWSALILWDNDGRPAGGANQDG